MPFAFDQLNHEASVEQHDAEAIEAGSTERDCASIIDLLGQWSAPSGPLLDIGCGSGRHVRELAAHGYQVTGVDTDLAMCAAAQAAGIPTGCTVINTDASALDLKQRFAAALLCNRSLACFHSHRQAWGLFQSVSQHLLPGGLFLIDNLCTALWGEIANGHYGDGMASDASEQMFFLPGENRFIWRRGSAVDPESWSPKPSDRVFRLWSLNEVALAAAGSRLITLELSNDAPFIVLQAPPA